MNITNKKGTIIKEEKWNIVFTKSHDHCPYVYFPGLSFVGCSHPINMSEEDKKNNKKIECIMANCPLVQK